jgi:hypothetical protein
MDETITLRSTSLNSAIAEDIVLRLKDNTRLIFRPMVINNPNFPAECKRAFYLSKEIKNK